MMPAMNLLRGPVAREVDSSLINLGAPALFPVPAQNDTLRRYPHCQKTLQFGTSVPCGFKKM